MGEFLGFSSVASARTMSVAEGIVGAGEPPSSLFNPFRLQCFGDWAELQLA